MGKHTGRRDRAEDAEFVTTGQAALRLGVPVHRVKAMVDRDGYGTRRFGVYRAIPVSALPAMAEALARSGYPARVPDVLAGSASK